MDEGLALFLEQQGPAPDAARPERAHTDAYRGRLPDGLIDFWREAGWGWYAGGRLRLCDPAVLEGAIEGVFDGDADLRPGEIVGYAYTAFGQVQAWHARYGSVTLHVPDGRVSAPGYLDPADRPLGATADATDDLAANLFGVDWPKAAEWYGEGGKPLFARARRALGPLGPDEVYGFVPLLALGGAPRLENLRRLAAREHLAIAAQAQAFALVDYLVRPMRLVREIGG